MCLNDSIFSNELQKALIIPLYKKSDSTNIENYRPISFVTIFLIIYQKCMSTKITKYFQSCGLFTDGQFRFRQQ